MFPKRIALAAATLLALSAAAAEPTTRPANPLAHELGPHNPKVVALQQQLEALDLQSAEIDNEVRRLRSAVAKATSRPSDTPQSLRNALETLANEQLKLEIDKVGLTARRDALTDAVAHVSVEAQKHVEAQNAQVLQSLEAQLKIRAAEVERTRQLFQAAAASSSDVAKAEAELEAAKANLARERATVQKSPDLETLTTLNRQLIDASITLAETAARLQYVSHKLESLKDAQDVADRLETLERARLRLEEEAARLRTPRPNTP